VIWDWIVIRVIFTGWKPWLMIQIAIAFPTAEQLA
jgi:hypothetical protein